VLKQQAALFNKISILTDHLVIICSFFIAYHARLNWGGASDFLSHSWVLLIIMPVWHFLLTRFGLHASVRLISFGEIFASLIKVQCIGAIITSAAIFFVDPHGFSRGILGGFLGLSLIFLAIEKIAVKAGLGYFRALGFNFRNILIVGIGEESRIFIKLLEKQANWGLRVAGLLHMQNQAPRDSFCGYKIRGSLDDLVRTCKSNPVDEVVFCLPMNSIIDIEEQMHDLVEMGITVRMVLDLYDIRRARRELSLFHGQVPILTFYYKTFDAGQLLSKRCLDVFGAVIGLGITALFFPLIAVAVKLDSPGPLFFGQRRMGENGRIFKCWKFRSMYIDAEERKKDLAHLNEMNGAIFKIKDDPRITRVGKFLRKTSLDELPQFWNVLRGEMSLVGTRPPTPEEVENYENWQRRRISIRPGMTGLWQISGRNRIQDFDKIVHLDLNYIDNWSLYLDIRIMFRTLWVVMARKGSS
jgi:exopolysaccharide biosynthesis polyprenyl glycosylphosphotransferase